MDEARRMYTDEIGSLPGFKVYKSMANFILIKYPIELKAALQQEFAGQSYKVKFMDEPDINSHMRITLGRREQNRMVADIILKVAKHDSRNISAGMASRLRPLTDDRPKCLLRVGSKCIL